MGKRSRTPSSTTKLLLAITVLVVVGLFTYFYYVQSVHDQAPVLLIDWRLKVTFEDASQPPGINWTLPPLIGSSPQYWANHTLDGFSPSTNFSPMSTRDGTSTIYLQSTLPAVFNFGDFFNVYGQSFNETCVGYAGVAAPTGQKYSGNYCTRAAEPIIYDANSNNVYDPSTDTNVSLTPNPLSPRLPPPGASLASDSHIMFASVNSSLVWNANESIVYDANRNGVYDQGDSGLYVGRGQALISGMTLSNDPKLKFHDWNGNGRWDASVPPPILSDGVHAERCLDRGINLSKGYDWVIFLWSSLYHTISGNCIPPGS